MRLYNIKQRNEEVTFSYALMQGLGSNQGLFFPVDLPKFSISQINELLEMNFIERSVEVLYKYIGSELSKNDILDCVKNAFNFPVPLIFLKNNIAILELFHGPTLAFKDFGCRLMAQMLVLLQKNKQKLYTKPTVILVATSGDTGAAVAHAFYKLKNMYVIILYPKDKINILQKRLFCALGDNVFSISVNGDFDVCQSLVKKAFDDSILKKELSLNSGNSINISRLFAQVCYYFEAVSQLPSQVYNRNQLVVSVPSGNFGNLTAGLLAQSIGLPIKKFIAATNLNDTVPRFLRHGIWNPLPTVKTFANAMDVSCPSNWSRIEELFYREHRSVTELGYGCVNDNIIEKTVQEIADLGYISDPHTAVAYRLLCDQLNPDEFGLCLSTAHPAKFKGLVERFLREKLSILIPYVLQKYMQSSMRSYQIEGDFFELRDLILKIVL